MSPYEPRLEGLNTQPAPPSVVATLARHTEAEYLTHDLFMGEDADIKCRTVKLVTARKPHACWLGQALGAKPHEIAIGELHRYGKALVDGDYWVAIAAAFGVWTPKSKISKALPTETTNVRLHANSTRNRCWSRGSEHPFRVRRMVARWLLD